MSNSRATNRLTHRRIETVKEPGRYADGGGLYLHLDKKGAKRWVFIYQWPPRSKTPRRREMGLGPLRDVGIVEARELRDAVRKQIRDGVDPIAERRKVIKEPRTFAEVARFVLDNLTLPDRSKRAWERCLIDMVPTLQKKRVHEIGAADIQTALAPHWATSHPTAKKMRGRIERVLDVARVAGDIEGPWDNPARWRGKMELMLAKVEHHVRHHPAMPHEDVGAFMARLLAKNTPGCAALQFCILTATRSGETRGATWGEIDFDAKVWIIPKGRMKMRRDHRVPLSAEALAVLDRAKPPGDLPMGAFIFPGQRHKKPLSDRGLSAPMKEMLPGLPYTPHGFRSAFRDWAGETTGFSWDVIETALAHQVGDDTERAYRRGDLLDKRRKLMDAWGSYCSRPASAKVLPMKRAG